MSDKAFWASCIGTLLIVVLLTLLLVFGVHAPASAQFNAKFAAHETMAHDSATFEKMREQIMVIWVNMNATWNPNDFSHIYGDWWYPNQNYENSLQATQDYFDGLVERIDATVEEMNEIKAGNKTILQPYNAYYQQQLEAFRNETFDAGGLLWAIRGAWFLSFAPLAYWSGVIILLCWGTYVIVWVLIIFVLSHTSG